jgi:type II secretory pathway pseudopilin PulG
MLTISPSLTARRGACRGCRRKLERGFTIMEVTLALMIFAMMTILFAAVFPMTIRGAQYSSNYSQAAMVAQHKMDQLRSAGYSSLDLSHLSNLSVVDSPQPNGYPTQAVGGSTYSFTTADGLVSNGVTQGFFPAGSQGTVTIADYSALHPASGIPANTMYYVTVTVAWVGGGVSNGSYSTSAIIAKTT